MGPVTRCHKFTTSTASACLTVIILCIISAANIKPARCEGLVSSVPWSHLTRANLLRSSGFKLRAKVDFWGAAGGPASNEFELIETYSVASERATLELRVPGIKNRKYHVNGTSKQVTVVDLGRRTCEEIDREVMMGQIMNNMKPQLRDRFIETWLKSVEGAPDYMIGMGRLLQFTDLARGQWEVQVANSIRGRVANRYILEKSPFGADVKMTAVMSQTPFVTWSDSELPMRVWLKADSFGLILVEFFALEPLADTFSPLEDADYFVDPTTVELGLKCLAATKHEVVMPYREVYSMTVDVLDVSNDETPTRRYFLAYDGKQMAFRRDSLNEDGSPLTSTITDMKRNRKFNIRHESVQAQQVGPPPDPDYFEEEEAPSVIKPTQGPEGAECVAGVSTGETPDLFEMPVGAFVHLGQGVVRGIEVDIYERHSYHEPYLFEPSLSYIGKDSQWRRVTQTLNIMDDIFGEKYSVIYYFARAQSLGGYAGPLVRVDVMLASRLTKQINVHDFVWQLADAPSGERQESLFSVPNPCFGGRSGTTSARVSHKILMKAQLDFASSSKEGAISEADSMLLLDNPVTRQKALVRSLVGPGASPDVSASRFLDVTSTLTKSGDKKFQMHASVTLSLGGETEAWQPRWVGTYVLLQAKQRPVAGATNFDECFFEAVRRRRGEETLFAFIHEACYIDTAPIYEYRANERAVKEIVFTYSGVFRITRLEGPLGGYMAMRVERVESRSRLAARSVQADMYEPLMNNHLVLPIVDTTHPQWLGESLLFKVTKLEFSSVRDPEEPARNSVALDLDGLNLMTGSEVEKSPDGQEMSFEMCRAACLMDLSCRSYSVCNRGLSTGCRTSELDFDDANLVKELAPRLRSARAAQGRSCNLKVSFDYQQESSGADENSDSNQNSGEKQPQLARHVELELSKRCRVYKKRALDMFAELPRSVALLKSKAILQVDSEEECAKHCLDNNIRFFQKSRDAGLPDPKAKDLVPADEFKKQHMRRLNSWCAMFKYLNLKTSTDGQRLLALKQLAQQEKDAICILSKPRGGSMRVQPASAEQLKVDSGEDGRAKVELDTFEFEYTNLYETHGGVWMAHSSKPSAGQGVVNQRNVTKADNPEACARACFTQSIGLEPYCKSFEFIQRRTYAMTTEGKATTRAINMCAFNSVSLSDARKSNYYDQIVSSTPLERLVKVTFYEPREAYMISESVMRRLLEPTSSQFISAGSIHVFAPLLVLVLALASGTALGIWAKEPLVDYWLARKEQDDDLIPRRKFSNGSIDNAEIGGQL